jgi:hypothetical protein
MTTPKKSLTTEKLIELQDDIDTAKKDANKKTFSPTPPQSKPNKMNLLELQARQQKQQNVEPIEFVKVGIITNSQNKKCFKIKDTNGNVLGLILREQLENLVLNKTDYAIISVVKE